MTEADWRATSDVDAMLGFLSRRWQRLGFDPEPFSAFAAACSRRVQLFLADNLRSVVEHLQAPRSIRTPDTWHAWAIYRREYLDLSARVSEAMRSVGRGVGDARATGELLVRWRATLTTGYAESSSPYQAAAKVAGDAARAIELADRLASFPPGSPIPDEVIEWDDDLARSAVETAAQADLVRCVFGNPFRPVAFEAAWRTEAVVALARGMDESSDFAALPVLADALEDAGCADAELLAHCRGAGPHARGCHAIDHVLGRW